MAKKFRIVRRSERGFALVLTLSLLALLVLAVFALSALARVNSRIASSSLYQTQARQNARVALKTALGELQRYAGPDVRFTGMAGMSGELAQSSFRQWTGVWNGSASPVWLVSGSNGTAGARSLAGVRLTIVGPGSVGNPADRTDQEIVEVGFVDVPGIDAQGLSTKTGRIGYWVGDEGIKVSAIITDDEMQVGMTDGRGIRPNFRGLIGATFDPSAATNVRLIAVEQLGLAVSGFSLGSSFHSLTRTHMALPTTVASSPKPGNYVIGAFNINTTSETAWRALLQFPDSVDPAFKLDADRSLSAARQIRDRIALRGQPFGSVADLLASNIIQQSFDSASPKIVSLTQEDFIAELTPILATRSDTFRIRGYGDALDSVDNTTVRASAYCEAIVQRTPELAPGALGHRFVITYFRWLGRDDI